MSVALGGVRAPPWLGAFRLYCRSAMRAIGAEGWELSVLLCDDATIRGLNARYRGIDRATDVLSFSQREGGAAAGSASAAGDLVISLETARRNAGRLGVGEGEELRRLAVHGMLHLAGMDHGRGRGGAMLELQERLLAGLAGGRGDRRHPRRRT